MIVVWSIPGSNFGDRNLHVKKSFARKSFEETKGSDRRERELVLLEQDDLAAENEALKKRLERRALDS